MSRPPNDARRDEVQAMRAMGMRPSEIASRLGVSESLVNYYCGSKAPAAPLPASYARARLSEDAVPPAPPSPSSDEPESESSSDEILSDTLRTIRNERDEAQSSADRLRASELLLRHAGGLKSEGAWSPPEAVWKAFLKEAATECLESDEPR